MNSTNTDIFSSNNMTSEQHIELLGKLVTNFHILETTLRIVLLKKANEQDLVNIINFCAIPAGTKISTNSFTGYETLGKLISNFNRTMKPLDKPEIDESLIEIRDTIAHGRIFCVGDGFPLRIIKFSKPDENMKVELQVNQVMSKLWFEKRIGKTHNAIQIARLGMSI